jgi:hypothetical protein
LLCHLILRLIFAHETHESRQYKSKLPVCIAIAITHPFRSHGR